MDNTHISLETTIAGIKLSTCIYNASGPKCTNTKELNDLGNSIAGAILSKSATLEYRKGNEKPRYYDTEWGSINSMGLPNEGYKFYADYAEQAITYNKPYIVSVSGMRLEDNVTIIKYLSSNKNISAIELNLSCPNLQGKPQTGYDFEQSRILLEKVFEVAKQPLGVKLPPYFDIPHFEMMAEVLNDYPISFATCINSIGNGLVIDPDKECVVIKPKQGFGGIGGDFVKPTALANIHKFYCLLKNDVDIIGVGGIKNGIDAFEHILCGASAIQIGTQLMREGTACFSRIANELKDIMKEKGYTSIDDFKGKLKEIES